MKNKYWFIVALFLVAVAGAYIANAIKNHGTKYVVNMNNVIVKYDESAIKSEIANIPNEMKQWFDNYRKELKKEPSVFLNCQRVGCGMKIAMRQKKNVMMY